MCKYACRGARNLRILLDGRESYLSRLRTRFIRALRTEWFQLVNLVKMIDDHSWNIRLILSKTCYEKNFKTFFKKMESEEMEEGHLSWYLYLNLVKDPVCKCAQKLSQVSFGCTFLFGSTVVMINLIMFVHLRNVYSEIYSERR